MSKYFNETQKTEELFAQESIANRQDVAAILRELRQANVPVEAANSVQENAVAVSPAPPAPSPEPVSGDPKSLPAASPDTDGTASHQAEESFAPETIANRQDVATILRELRQASVPVDAASIAPASAVAVSPAPPVSSPEPAPGRQETSPTASSASILAGSLKTGEWFGQEAFARRQETAASVSDEALQSRVSDAAPTGTVAVGSEFSPEPPTAPSDRQEICLTASSPTVLTGSQSGHYAMEAYRALRTRLMRLQASKGVHSLVMSSATPGEGKTLTTINLGLCYSQLHEMPVLLIDADLRSRRLSQFLRNAPASGLAEVLAGQATHDEVIRRTEYANLYVLTSGRAVASPPELFTGPAWGNFLAHCKSKFKIVLVDAPPVRPLADFELICASCDGLLVVVRAQQTQREQLHQVAGQIDTKKLVGIVLNCADSSSKDGYYGQYGSPAY